MPKVVNYYLDKDQVPRSAASGAVLKQGVSDTTRATYQQVDAQEAQRALKAQRKRAGANAKASYREQYEANMPNVYEPLAGKRVGSSRDSVVSALNRAYAASMDIPLNAANRTIMKAIYADEMGAAIGARDADFAKFQGQFARGKGKKGKVPKL